MVTIEKRCLFVTDFYFNFFLESHLFTYLLLNGFSDLDKCVKDGLLFYHFKQGSATSAVCHVSRPPGESFVMPKALK